MNSVVIRKPVNLHTHLRTGELLKLVAHFATAQFRTSLLMLNFKDDPCKTIERGLAYVKELASVGMTPDDFILALYLDALLSPDVFQSDVNRLFGAGKLYPAGVTTNSEGGVTDFDAMDATYDAMQAADRVLCIHAEMPGRDIPDSEREALFIPEIKRISSQFPQLRVVVEHVSDYRMLAAVAALPDKVAATITAHHPFLVMADARRDPHCYCLPIAKDELSRSRLYAEMLSADETPKFFYGGDSAPHFLADKLSWAGGVFSDPTAVPFLFEVFERAGKWEAWEAFMSGNGSQFYGLPVDESDTLTLHRESWRVPPIHKGLTPWQAGNVLRWRVEGMRWFGETLAA
jgi:dihydroorotase